MPYFVEAFQGHEIWFHPAQGQYSVGQHFDQVLSGYSLSHVKQMIKVCSAMN